MSGVLGRVLVFDSGIGGLSIASPLRQALPQARIDYLADTALFPYGEQPDAILTDHIVHLIGDACARRRYDLVVIACNTASTLALSALRARLPVPLAGCVPPIRWAGRVSLTRTIGLLATSATVRRPYVAQLRDRYAPDCRLLVHGARQLADLAERAFLGETIADHAVSAELDALLSQPYGERIDTIGIGCTHYSVLLPTLERLASARGLNITWLDPAHAVARHSKSILATIGLDAQRDTMPENVRLTAPPQNPEALLAALATVGFHNSHVTRLVA